MEMKLTNGPLYDNVIMIRKLELVSKVLRRKKLYLLVTLNIDGEPHEAMFNVKDIEYVR